MTSLGADDGGAQSGGWACAMCTFENDGGIGRCAICLTPRQSPPRGNDSSPSPAKKSRSSTSPDLQAQLHQKQPKHKIQKPLVAVGSSSEQEALRLQKKIAQLRELGIDLPANDVIALLARSCYSVPAAVSAYFERMAVGDTAPAAHDTETERRIASARAHFETAFAREPFRLVGSKVVSATLNRSAVSLAAGDRLVLQAENAGKKRLRPGSAGVGSATTTGATVTSSLSAGIIRVATAQNSLVGRLDREMEKIYQPLMKERLVVLGGVCHSAPTSSQMFASFEVLVFVYVHAKAFAIFREEHPQFHLSDALYSALEMMHAESAGASPADANALPSSTEDKDAGLEALFSDVVGSGVDEDEASHAADVVLAEQLAPYLKDITLRDHQRVAVRWMLARENQVVGDSSSTSSKEAAVSSSSESAGSSSSVAEEINPMWETRRFQRGESSYFVNRFEKIASLAPPQPPSPCLGGILADDMGMGKTMTMLALIAHQKHCGSSESRRGDGADGGGDAAGATPTSSRSRRLRRDNSQRTLVVCPLSLLHQWKNEVEERFRTNTLGVHVYYGDDRESSAALFGASDVVLTTYGVLSKEFEKPVGTGALLVSPWRRVVLDEAHSIKNRLTTYFRACSALRATYRWCLTGTPLQNSLDDLFSLLCFLQYEPWSRVSWWKRVIATPFEQGDETSALGRLKVVLSPILLRRTKHTRDKHGKNLVQLPPKHVELVQLAFSEEERTFYQAVYDKSRAEFNGYVASGTANTSYVAIFALLLRLRQACNHPFLALGRNHEEAQASVGAPSSSRSGATAGSSSAATGSSLFRPQSGESMAAYYSRISTHLQQDLHHGSSGLDVVSSQDGGGGLLMPAFTREASATESSNDSNSSSARASGAGGLTKSYIESVLAQVEEGLESHECPVCLDPPVNGVLTACAHVLCEQCLRDSVANDPESGCPVCRAFVDVSKVFALPTPAAPKAQEDDDGGVSSTSVESATGSSSSKNVVDDVLDVECSEVTGVFLSTKLKQLLRDLTIIQRENEQSAKKRKVVVFSQWTYMLEMVAKLLQARGFAHCMFHGAMTQEARERVLTRFAKEPELDVLVISLKAGGVGLNLTCASVVILLDPWWNPGVEDQAIDRVHRLGQDQDVIVKRYVVDATVEDMILQLQQRKEKLAKHVLVASRHGDDKRSERLSLEDLKSFFR